MVILIADGILWKYSNNSRKEELSNGEVTACKFSYQLGNITNVSKSAVPHFMRLN